MPNERICLEVRDGGLPFPDEPKLTPKIFASIFPVSNSLRREHIDHFGEFLDCPDDFRDDEYFYGALLDAAREDPDLLVQFDVRLTKSGKRKLIDKTFGRRVMSWLRTRPGAPETHQELLNLDHRPFPRGTLEWVVHDLLMSVWGATLAQCRTATEDLEEEIDHDLGYSMDDADDATGPTGTEDRDGPDREEEEPWGSAPKEPAQGAPTGAAVGGADAMEIVSAPAGEIAVAMPTASWRSAATALVRRLEAIAEPDPEALAEIRQAYLAFQVEAARAAEAGRAARLAAAREDRSVRLAAIDWDRLPEGIGMKAAGLRERASAADARSILAIGSRIETLFEVAAKALATSADTARLWKTYQAAAQAAVGDPALLEQAQEAASAFQSGRRAEAALADEPEAALDGATRLLREDGETRAPAATDQDGSAPGAPALAAVDDRDGRADGADGACAIDHGQENDGTDDDGARESAAPEPMTEQSATVPAGEEEKKPRLDTEAPETD